MNEEIYFFDTYAIIEILNGNGNYSKFADCSYFTSKLNAYELSYNLLKESKYEIAKKSLNDYYSKAIDFDQEIIIMASKLKVANRKLSMTDCIGYCIAMKKGIKFLTGDKEFEKMDNVEFVK